MVGDRRMPWPYAAKEVRDKCAEDANAIVAALDPLLDDRPLSQEQITRMIARASNKARDIRARLQAQGAQIVF